MAITKNNTANVSVGKGLEGGYMFVAPTSQELPSSLDEAFAIPTVEESKWRNLGYLGEDGISLADSSGSENYSDMNGDAVEKGSGTTEKTYTVKLLEIKNDTLKFIYGEDNSSDEAGVITTHDKGQNTASYRTLFLLLLKDGRRQARVAGNTSISELGDENVTSTALMGREVTISVLKDTETGDYWTIYTDSTETQPTEETGGSSSPASFQAETIGVAEQAEKQDEGLAGDPASDTAGDVVNEAEEETE